MIKYTEKYALDCVGLCTKQKWHARKCAQIKWNKIEYVHTIGEWRK